MKTKLVHGMQLETIRDGKILDMANADLAKIAKDIRDLDKPPTTPRELVIKVKFTPSKGRGEVGISIATEVKLAKRHPLEAVCVVSEDSRGNPMVSEQIDMDDVIDSLRGISITPDQAAKLDD